MTNDKVAPALEQGLDVFRREEERLQVQLNDLKSQERDLQFQLKRVRATLAPYRGGKGGPKPSLSDAQVLELVLEILGSGPMRQKQVIESVNTQARSRGFSAAGVHLAVPRVLRDPRFLKSQDGWSLQPDAKLE